MRNSKGEYVCESCGRIYDAVKFHEAVEREYERARDKKDKRYLSFSTAGKGEFLSIDQEYNALVAYTAKLYDIKRGMYAYNFCCEDCVDKGLKKREAEAAREKAAAERKKAEIAKNRHNPFYIVKENPKGFLFVMAEWLVPMFLLWRSFLPLPLIVLVSVFLSYLLCWSGKYDFLKKFDLYEPIRKFQRIFAFLYALTGAVEVVRDIFDIPYAVEDVFEFIGRDAAYVPMVLLALVVMVVHSLLRKPLFKKIPSKVSDFLKTAATFAIPAFSLFHLLSYWIAFPISAVLAVVGTVFVYKNLGDLGNGAVYAANFVLSEAVFA